MAAVGSLTIHAWRGTVQGESKQTQIITRPGVDGTGMLVSAYQSKEFDIETDFYSTLANVLAWQATALTYPGTTISTTDAFGVTYTDTVIIDVRSTIVTVKGLGSSTHLIRSQWRMLVDY